MPGAVTALLAAVLAAQPGPPAARWLTPDWGRAGPPPCAPVALFWFTVDTCPLLYRTEVDIPRAAAAATVLVRSSGYVYVQVDGRQVYGWTPDAHPPVGPPEPISTARVHAADLTRALTPGRHVLSVSAPAGGFALDGVVRDAGGAPVARLRSDARWTVARLAATTVIEDDPSARLGHAGETPVRIGKAWTAPRPVLRAATDRFAAARARADDDEARWRAELLAESGRYIIGSTNHGWGGGERLDPALRAAARSIAEQPPATAARSAARKLAAIERLSRQAYVEDEARALGLLGSAVSGTWPRSVPADRADLAALRAAMESALGHPANHLNESRYDRLGWIDLPGLLDNDVRRWGVRLNPVIGAARGPLPQPWRFALDPDDRGLRERWWSPGYNADDNWPTLATHDGWTNDARFANYRGIGWYRNAAPVPDQCAGEPIVFTVHQWGDVRIWVNGVEITASRSGAHPTRYTIPPELLAWSGDNLVAVRAATTDLPKTGIGEPMEFTCPTLDVAAAAAMPPVDVLATPLSPAAVWMPRTASIELRHTGTLAAGTRSAAGWRWNSDYDARRDGRLPANWILLDWRPEGRPLRSAPLLLVFERNPRQIASVPGRTRIRLHGADERIVAVRPWGDEPPPGLETTAALERLTLWSRAARALPINYLSVTRPLEPAPAESALAAGALPPGPLLEQTMVYDYLRSSDEWGTAALELAPLPALAAYALERRPAALEVRAAIEVLQPAGMLAPYRVARGADRLSYRYRVEPYQRLAGFTAWMFSGFDAGVLGNRREVELIAAIGANSFRPQHNDSLIRRRRAPSRPTSGARGSTSWPTTAAPPASTTCRTSTRDSARRSNSCASATTSWCRTSTRTIRKWRGGSPIGRSGTSPTIWSTSPTTTIAGSTERRCAPSPTRSAGSTPYT